MNCFFIVLLGRRACHTEHLYTVPTECRTPGPAIDRCQHTMTMLLVAKTKTCGTRRDDSFGVVEVIVQACATLSHLAKYISNLIGSAEVRCGPCSCDPCRCRPCRCGPLQLWTLQLWTLQLHEWSPQKMLPQWSYQRLHPQHLKRQVQRRNSRRTERGAKRRRWGKKPCADPFGIQSSCCFDSYGGFLMFSNLVDVSIVWNTLKSHYIFRGHTLWEPCEIDTCTWKPPHYYGYNHCKNGGGKQDIQWCLMVMVLVVCKCV